MAISDYSVALELDQRGGEDEIPEQAKNDTSLVQPRIERPGVELEDVEETDRDNEA